MKYRSQLPADREEKKQPKQKKTLQEAAQEMKQRWVDERFERKRLEVKEAHFLEEEEVMRMILGPQAEPEAAE